MNFSVYFTGAIMAAFMLGSVLWSFSQVRNGIGIWRVIHLAIALTMLAGGMAIYMNQGGIGMLLGILLLVLALAVMFVEKSQNKWLAVIQFITGAILASGLLFGAG